MAWRMRSAQSVILVILVALMVGGCKSQRTSSRGSYRTEKATGGGSSGTGVVARDVVRESKNALVAEAERWLGTPYKYGGSERGKGTDCSGMTMEIYRKVLGVKIPRNSAAQQQFCTPMKREKLEAGDLVFFSTGKGRGRVGHVGLYVADGVFVHASSSRGVIASNLDETYYSTHYHSSGRVPGLPRGAVGGKVKSGDGDKKKDRSKKRPEVGQGGALPEVLPPTVSPEVRERSERADSVVSDALSPAIEADTSRNGSWSVPAGAEKVRTQGGERCDSVGAVADSCLHERKMMPLPAGASQERREERADSISERVRNAVRNAF